MTEPQKTAKPRKRLSFGFKVLIGVVGIIVAYAAVQAERLLSHQRHSLEIQALLNSDSPDQRKEGAWTIADRNYRSRIGLLLERYDAEPVADVREADIYAIGRLAAGNDEMFAELERRLASEPEGFARQAIWLALARIDAAKFRQVAGAVATRDAWDRLGITLGEMETGDVSDWETLFELARDRDEGLRMLAKRAIQRHMAPLLVTCGQWPFAGSEPYAQWSDALVDDLEVRCRRQNLQAIADDAERHAAVAAKLRANVGKLAKTRDRIARVLFWRR